MRLAGHPPTGFIGMQPGGFHRFLMQLFVPRKEHFLKPIPHLSQAAGRDFQLHMEIKDIHNLIKRIAKGIMLPGA